MGRDDDDAMGDVGGVMNGGDGGDDELSGGLSTAGD